VKALPHPEIEMAWVAWVATFGGHWPILDRLAVALADNELLKTAPYMLVLVGFWHARDPRHRAGARREVVAGMIAAGLAVVVSRLVQDLFTSVRPIWDPVQSHLFPVEFQRVVEPDYHSFPSDHVALMTPLALTVFRLDRRLGWIGLGWLLVVSLVRLYLGLHYPVDILGGALLGVLAFGLIHARFWRVPDAAVRGVESLERRQPAMTAVALFFVAYQYSTLFAASRDLGHRMVRMFALLAQGQMGGLRP